ncbi:MAG: FmdE family protein [Desulfurococcales archaeon]|nr:FmdE family protein [Desulfurococcales archaeon]
MEASREGQESIVPELEPRIFYNPRYEINELVKRGDMRKLMIKAAELHGHFCIGLAMGVKASMLALKELGVELPERDVTEHVRHELIAVVDNNLCFADGVQMIIGATLGNNSLVFRDMGKISLTLIDKKSKRAVRVTMIKPFTSPTIENEKFQELFRKVMVRREQVPKKEAEAFRSMMDRASLEVLSLPENEYFKVEKFEVEDVNDEAFKGPSVQWVKCAHCGGLVIESKAFKKEDQGKKYYCADCAGEKVYSVVGRKIDKISLSDIARLIRM